MPIVLICLMLVYAGLGAFSWLQHKKHNNKSYPLKNRAADFEWRIIGTWRSIDVPGIAG